MAEYILPRQEEDEPDYRRFIIYDCIVGSRAYGLDIPGSDTDRRGIYLPPASLHWSLYGVPEQLVNDAEQSVHWELQKFIVLALKANPTVLECLFTSLVETATPLALELRDRRSIFLSRYAYQTYNNYVLSQFKKLSVHMQSSETIRWKHAMHLIRLLLSGIELLREGTLDLHTGQHRKALLAIRRGEWSWEEVNRWRMELHEELERAFQKTHLPESPDIAAANDILVRGRRSSVE